MADLFVLSYLLFLVIGLLANLVIGIRLLATSAIDDKKRKFFGIILIILSVFYFILINLSGAIFLESGFAELSALLIIDYLIILVNLVGGIVLLRLKEVKRAVRIILGILLLTMPIIYIIMQLFQIF